MARKRLKLKKKKRGALVPVSFLEEAAELLNDVRDRRGVSSFGTHRNIRLFLKRINILRTDLVLHKLIPEREIWPGRE